MTDPNILNLTIRLAILVMYALTAGACIARVFRTNDLRARVGNVAFGMTCAAMTEGQAIRLNGEQLRSSTWLAFIGGLLCMGYLVTLVRKGL